MANDYSRRWFASFLDTIPDVAGAQFLVLDLRELSSLTTQFDAAMILWQSFGYFDSATNDQLLGDIARRVRPGGRLLLDLYHPAFVEAHVGTQTTVRAPDCRSISNVVDHGRLKSTIEYDDGSTESMDFELFDPEALSLRASRHGWSAVEACSWWDASRPPSAHDQRYQLVLERKRPMGGRHLPTQGHPKVPLASRTGSPKVGPAALGAGRRRP